MKVLNAISVMLLCASCCYGQKGLIRMGLPLGHDLWVSSAQFSPDGKWIVTASGDRTVKIWDVGTGKMLRNLTGHHAGVLSVQFSPGGGSIVTASYDGTAKVWDVATGLLIWDLTEHTDAVISAHFSPDGKRIATASWDGTAKIWDVASGKILFDLTGHIGHVLSAQFSPDGKSLVTAGLDDTGKIWDVGSGKMLRELKGHTSTVSFAQFSPSGERIVTSSIDGTVKVWEALSGKVVWDMIVDGYALRTAHFFPRGERLITTSQDGTIEIWEIASRRMLYRLEGHNGSVRSIHFAPDGKSIVSISEDGTAKIWDVVSGKLLQDLTGHTDVVSSAHFSADGRTLVTSSYDRTARIWDVSSGKMLMDLKGHTRWILSAIFSPDGKSLLTASEDSTAKVWDVASGKMLQDLTGHADRVSSARFSPDGKTMATACYDGVLRIWDTSSGSKLQEFPRHSKWIFSAQFSTDGNSIVTATDDDTARIWNVSTETISMELIGHTDVVREAQFSPDGKSVVTSSYDETVRIWDVASGELQAALTGHLHVVHSAQFSPDGKSVVTASSDRSAKIWDVASGKTLMDLQGHSDDVISSCFSPDGKHIVTASDDGTSKIWDVTTGKLLQDLEGHQRGVRSAQFSPNGKMVLTASLDGSIMLWQADTGKELMQHFIFENSESVTLAPNGLFDATPGAMEWMYWVKGDEVIDFDQLKDRYWEPGLWEKIMNGQALRDVRGMNLLKSAPEVEVGDVQQGMLPVVIKKRDGGYGKVTVSINGKEVEADARGGRELDPARESHRLLVPVADSPLLIPGEENSITVKAWSEDGFVEGRGVIVRYTPDREKETVRPAFHAVICGVNEYGRNAINLRYAEPDARAVALAVRLGAEELFGKENTHIHTLTSPGNNMPTRDNIRRTFESIGRQAKPEDILLIYLSGHGIAWGGDAGDFYFLTSEAFSSSAEAYNDPAIRERTAISSMELTEWIKEVPALKQVMILDACGAGKAVDNLLARRNVDASQIKAIDRMKDRTGMFIISGCAADAVSFEANQYGQGLLTYAILQGMKGLALKEDKYVDVNTVLSYAREQVPMLAKGVGGIQEPQLLLPKGGSFDIGVLDANTRKRIPLANPKPVFVRSTFLNIEASEDDLQLAAHLDEHLSELSVKGSGAELIFVDAKQYPDVCKVSGSYIPSSSGWELKGKMKCGAQETAFALAAASETALKEKLLAWVLAQVTE